MSSTRTREVTDDLGFSFQVPHDIRRVVSLVPSITEAIAATDASALVAATDWCTHPVDLSVTRIRGTKNPNIQAIVDTLPDLVIANQEENREIDVHRLRDRGVAVYVTKIESVAQAIDSLTTLFDRCLGWGIPTWLTEVAHEWAEPVETDVSVDVSVAVPIWRDPWIIVGPRTYANDLLRYLGARNVYETASDRYPHVDLAALDSPSTDVILLPDEPYVFSETDGPECFHSTSTELVSGRLLTWYGPAMVGAREILASSLHPYRKA